MDSCFIMSVAGPLSPDIINKLAHHSRSQGASWIISKVIRLDNQFVALMKVVISGPKDAPLRASLKANFKQLHFSFDDAFQDMQVLSSPITFELDCADRAGLTHEIHQRLASLNIVIDHFESYRVPVSTLGRNMYRAKLVLRLPTPLTCNEVIEALEAMEGDVRVTEI